MNASHVCCLCLAHYDLMRITKDRECIINLVLQQELSKDIVSLICINCSNTLNCIDKFQKNSKAAQKILKAQNTSLPKNNFLDVPSATQDKVSGSFDCILNWLIGVNVVLEHHPIKKEPEAIVLDEEESVDSIIISGVYGPDFVSEDFFPEEEDVQFVENDNNCVDLVESSAEALDEQLMEKIDKTSEVQKDSHVDKELKKYRDKTKIGGKRSYKCPECQTFFGRSELKFHFNYHKGVFPYKCILKECSSKFYSPYHAAQHCNQSHNLKISVTKWTGKDLRRGKRRIFV